VNLSISSKCTTRAVDRSWRRLQCSAAFVKYSIVICMAAGTAAELRPCAAFAGTVSKAGVASSSARYLQQECLQCVQRCSMTVLCMLVPSLLLQVQHGCSGSHTASIICNPAAAHPAGLQPDDHHLSYVQPLLKVLHTDYLSFRNNIRLTSTAPFLNLYCCITRFIFLQDHCICAAAAQPPGGELPNWSADLPVAAYGGLLPRHV
jgi:hypothetical protein